MSHCDKGIICWSQKCFFFYSFCGQLNVSFVALTQCDEQISMKWQLRPKKEDIVKIENHCTKKIRMGYLLLISEQKYGDAHFGVILWA